MPRGPTGSVPLAPLLLIGAAALAALLLAAAARPTSLVSALLLVYLALVANVGLSTLLLSPFHAVTRAGLGAAEVTWVALALAAWWARGRPGLPLAAARAAVPALVRDPVTGPFLVVIACVLGYELALGLTVPPSELDGLTYHLARAAAWAEHGGVYWIANAPTVRLNAFQPLAEQLELFLIVACGGGALYALPQFLAQGAILVAVYGASRRLGFDVRASACGSCLLASFSLLALEASTAQNDLVAASFVAASLCLLLGPGRAEAALGGAAAAVGLGTKLTVGPVLPLLALLALLRGRRVLVWALVGGAAGLLALGMWGYVLNLVHTGHVLGVGTGAAEDRASPSFPGSLANAFDFSYALMDLSVLSNRLIDVLAVTAGLAAVATVVLGRRRRGARAALEEALAVATPFLSPLLVLGGAAALAYGAGRFGFPIRGSKGIIGPGGFDLFEYDRIANEDYSAFGPVGIVALLAVVALTLGRGLRRRADSRQLVLACALPLFLAYVSLGSSWSPYLTRFFVIPAVVVAPLLAHLFRRRGAAVAYALVASLVVVLTLSQDQTKPLQSRYFGRPWQMDEQQALAADGHAYMATALTDFDELVPAQACVGGVLGVNDPSYLLYGPRLEHRVVYLPSVDPLPEVAAAHLAYVVISNWYERPVAATFSSAGWRLRALGSFWLLASRPEAGAGACSRQTR